DFPRFRGSEAHHTLTRGSSDAEHYSNLGNCAHGHRRHPAIHVSRAVAWGTSRLPKRHPPAVKRPRRWLVPASLNGRVIQAGEDPGFVAKPLARCFVFQRPGGQNLEGEVALQFFVVGTKTTPIPPAPISSSIP